MSSNTNVPREDLQKQNIATRLEHFREFYLEAEKENLKKQSSRCLDCGVPLCQSPSSTNNGCPVQNLIPDWNELVSQNEWQKASELLHRTNNFPEFTGKLCPAPCESVCILGINDQPVTIRNIELSIVERAFTEGWIKAQMPLEKRTEKVAIIGSGPTGLAAAQQLARLGYDVTVFEKADKPGGLLRYGIPDFKIEKKFIDRRLEQLRQEGVQFVTNKCFGVDFTYEDLKKEFSAIGLALGAEKPRDLAIKGRQLGGIHFAMDYLSAQNKGLAQGELSAEGKNVAIIGGGDTGSDCLGTALRQKCIKAYQIEILPNVVPERKPTHAQEENKFKNGEQLWGTSTVEFISNEHGKVKALRTTEVELKDGQLQAIPFTERIIEVDMVILAMGFLGPVKEYLESIPLRYTNRQNVLADSRFSTNVSGVFAAGDVVRGASLIVWAIAEGRQMAQSIHEYLNK